MVPVWVTSGLQVENVGGEGGAGKICVVIAWFKVLAFSAYLSACRFLIRNGLHLRPSSAIWGHLGAILAYLGAILGPTGTILGPSWTNLLSCVLLRQFWVHLGPTWSYHGPFWRYLRPFWDHLGSSWGLESRHKAPGRHQGAPKMIPRRPKMPKGASRRCEMLPTSFKTLQRT